MSRKKAARHRVTISKRRLYGSRMWWAVCSCRTWYQGVHEKQEAQRLANEHIAKEAEP